MKSPFLISLFTLIICSSVNAQFKRLDFEKVVAIYSEESKYELLKNYNMDNEKDAAVVEVKKQLFQKDGEVIDVIVKATSYKFLTKELNHENSIEYLKKELTTKFPALNECFYSKNVFPRLSAESAKLNTPSEKQ